MPDGADDDDQWSARLSRAIGTKLALLRRGLSAQDLADRTAALGHPVARGVIANLENGRRASVNVADVYALAAALGVPPRELLIPTEPVGGVEVLPGVEISAPDAAQWIDGTRQLPAAVFPWLTGDVADIYAPRPDDAWRERFGAFGKPLAAAISHRMAARDFVRYVRPDPVAAATFAAHPEREAVVMRIAATLWESMRDLEPMFLPRGQHAPWLDPADYLDVLDRLRAAGMIGDETGDDDA